MTNVSRFEVLATVRVAVKVEASIRARVPAVTSAPLVKLKPGGELVLNSNPEGDLSTKVTFEPTPKSFVLPSAIVIGPRVVHEPEPPVAAVSAEMFEPPEAPVTVTAARVGQTSPTKTRNAAGRG